MERVDEALSALAQGKTVIVVDDFNRENEGDLVALAENVSAETVAFMATHGRGLICQAITAQRAEDLELSPMVTRTADPYRTAFTVTIDHVDASTGISAHERAHTMRAVADHAAGPHDFVRPGHVFPLIAREGGVLTRRGHTEAAVDLARLAGRTSSGVICEIMKDDGAMARLPDLEIFAKEHRLPLLSVEDLVRYRDAIADIPVTLRGESRLPTEYGEFHASVYTTADPAASELIVLESAGRDHSASVPAARTGDAGVRDTETEARRRETGDRDAGVRDTGTEARSDSGDPAPLVRLHSECLTGEAFGSHRCDCGPQLETALRRVGQEGGAVVYLRQEGRGIGLVEKIRAYALQDEGMDTVEANLALGHQADLRRFGAAAAALRSRGYRRVRLLTNNPEKEHALRRAGIAVEEREDLSVGVRDENRGYLRTKIEKFGHVLQGV